MPASDRSQVKLDGGRSLGAPFLRRSEPCSDCPSTVAFRTGEIAHASHTGIDKDGGTTYAEISAYPVKDGAGRVPFVIEYAKDISERIALERQSAKLINALRESEENYRTMVEHSNDFIWTLDRAGSFRWLNRQALQFGGYAPDDWVGKSFSPSGIVAEDLPAVE